MDENETFSEHNFQDAPLESSEKPVTEEPVFEVIGTAEPQQQPTNDLDASSDANARTGSTAKKKPVICLMGEFSAGKSTLSNLLIQTSALPVNVTATQLPPVWISKGNDAPYRVALDGGEYDIDLENLEDVSVDRSHRNNHL